MWVKRDGSRNTHAWDGRIYGTGLAIIPLLATRGSAGQSLSSVGGHPLNHGQVLRKEEFLADVPRVVRMSSVGGLPFHHGQVLRKEEVLADVPRVVRLSSVGGLPLHRGQVLRAEAVLADVPRVVRSVGSHPLHHGQVLRRDAVLADEGQRRAEGRPLRPPPARSRG